MSHYFSFFPANFPVLSQSIGYFLDTQRTTKKNAKMGGYSDLISLDKSKFIILSSLFAGSNRLHHVFLIPPTTASSASLLGRCDLHRTVNLTHGTGEVYTNWIQTACIPFVPPQLPHHPPRVTYMQDTHHPEHLFFSEKYQFPPP